MPTINDLQTLASISTSDLLAIWDTDNADTRKATISALTDYIAGQIGQREYVKQYEIPLTGETVRVNNDDDNIWLVLNPVGTLATLTVVLPAVHLARDGQEIIFTSSKTVTALTVDANGAAAPNAPAGLAATSSPTLRFDSTLKTWLRVS